ncbi:LysR family transcriptional regulator [Rhizobium tropici]|uniref:LysR family transcriptional regulator n=1 Tax=Rhizobium tropici TaxID=398 RepID=A0A329YBQ0_RHITR|nr:LysR family transcriptional regulator [Rhizobium tropici]RAX41331.1 LysR family transcriptional regulator [Rhizobium tropici]
MTGQAHGSLDIRLMRTLLILLTECSVSRTAELLGQAQPTVSLNLKRLREILDDPLLVRSGSTLVPTERGLALRETMREILSKIDTHLAPHPTFDPKKSTRHFRIVSTNCLGTVFLPPLIGAIARVAPGVSVDVSPMPNGEDLLSGMSEGAIDAVIGNWPHPPEHLRIAPILTTDIVCLVRPNHRFAKQQDRITLEEYLKESHLSPTSDRDAHISPIDGRLIELGLKRRIRATVPEYAIAPYVLAQSDLVFTTGYHFAEQVAQTFPFAVLDAPPELGEMHFYMLWHDCKHHSPDQVWLRRMIKSVAASMRALNGAALPPLPPMRWGQAAG